MADELIEPRTLAEAEVIARHAGRLNWWIDKIMEEYDRRGTRVTELEAQVKALEPALRELLDQTHMGNEATDMAWKQHNARHALMFVDGDPRA